MPVKFRRVRRAFRRRPVRKSKTTRAIAKRGLRVAKTLSRSKEVLYSNQTQTNALALAGTVSVLSGIGQGDTASLRTGNKITIRSIRMEGTFSTPSGATSVQPTYYRVIIFQDRQQVGDTTPAVTDILASGSNWDSPYNYPSVVKRFKILYDRMHVIHPQLYWDNTAAALKAQHTARVFKHWIFPTMKQVYFNGANASDLQKNHIYLLTIGQTESGAAPVANVDLEFQIAYNDF